MSATLTDERSTTVAAPYPRAFPRIAILAVGLGLVSLVVCFVGSWIPSLWGDEVTSVLSAERSLPSLFRMLGHVDAVHGTYYLFLHFWVQVFGASPVSVRFPSAIGAGITVAGVVALAARLAGFRTAVFAGLVCIVIPRVTYMGQEARGYAFSAALAVWVTYLLVNLLTGRISKPRWWVLYAVGVAACAYMFLFSLLLLPAHAIVVLVFGRRHLRTWSRSLLGAAVLALPILVYGVAERSQIAFLADRTAATFNSVAIGQWFGAAWCAIVCWSLLAVSVVYAIVRWRRTGANSFRPNESDGFAPEMMAPILGVTWLLIPPTVLLLVNFVDPIYSSRYLTFAAPAYAIIVGYFLGRVRRNWIAVPLIAALVATALPTYNSQRTPYAENSSDWAKVGAFIHSHARAGNAILFDETINPSKRPRLAMRAYPQDFVGLKDVALKSPWYDTDNWDDAVYSLADVPTRLDGIDTAWLIEYRAPGGTADNYDLGTLAQLGYATIATIQEHSDVIIELQRGVARKS